MPQLDRAPWIRAARSGAASSQKLQVGAVLGRDQSVRPRDSKKQELCKLVRLTHPSAAFLVVGGCAGYTSQKAGFPQKDRIRYPWEIW